VLGRVRTTGRPAGRTPGTAVGRIAVSRTRPPAWAHPVAEALGAELVGMGSAGAKVDAVLAGEVDAYLHDGGQYEWDSAAPVAVARAAGLHASCVDGSPLVYNKPSPWSPDLLVCEPGAAGRLVDLVCRYRKESAQ
jgi:3'(2'), 5'-bisphosphate nucleotidase